MKRAKWKSEKMIELINKYRQHEDYEWKTQDEIDTIYNKRKEDRKNILFIMTRQDTLWNLKFILDKVIKEFDWEIIEKYKTWILRKWRFDIFINTSDNKKFYNLFYNILDREWKLTNKTW